MDRDPEPSRNNPGFRRSRPEDLGVGVWFVDVPASVQPTTVRDLPLFAQRGLKYGHKVYVLQEPPFKRGDRLLTNDGRTFMIDGVQHFKMGEEFWLLVCDQIVE